AAELARARPGSAGGVAFLLDTATWAGPASRPGPDRTFQDSVRILLAGGWQVVPARATDDFAELWRSAGRHGFDDDRPPGPALGTVPSVAGTAAPDPAAGNGIGSGDADGAAAAPGAATEGAR